jgi:O-antigen ligase
MLSVYGVNIFRVIQESEKSIRIGDATSNSNSVGLSFAYGAVISSYMFTRADKATKIKWVNLAIIILTSAFTLLSGSKKALFVLAAGIFMVFLTSSNDSKSALKKIRSLIIAITVLVLLYYTINNLPVFGMVNRRLTQFLNGFSSNVTFNSTDSGRFEFIRVGWEAFLHHPIIGEGIYSSYVYFNTYSHNNFIEVLMNTGIIGFVIFYTPYVINLIRLSTIRKTEMYWLIAFLYFWITFGAYGFVTYYSKASMSLIIICSSWIEYTLRTNMPCENREVLQ